jgi:predicted RNase H-like HicB family nuclease
MSKSAFTYPQELMRLITAMPVEAVLSNAEDGGFFIYSDELPGCYAAGQSRSEAFNNFKEALFEYFEVPELYRKPDALLFESNTIPDSASLKSENHFNTAIDARLAFA